MKKYGCIGKPLLHSFSKEIHSYFADYDYKLTELDKEELQPFLEKRDFAAINVTIPYKQAVIPYLDFVSDIAKRIGAVNTIVNQKGKLCGYNTDYYGMKALIERVGVNLQGKKVLILGSGGTSKTAYAVATDMGASQILTVSHSQRENTVTYGEAKTLHCDADVIINTTPLGMYPNCSETPIDISPFTKLSGVIDAVYNPLCTNLVLNARARGIKAEGGLYMLVMQAICAIELFLDIKIEKSRADKVYSSILLSKENIVLTGMPSCGKSTVGRRINIAGYELFDTDTEIEKRCGCSIKELISTKGEEHFRNLEAEIIAEISSQHGKIISTGGGAVLREENIRNLRQNGKIFFLNADFSRLAATSDRPLSDTREKLLNLYNERVDIYQSTADVIVPDMENPIEAAEYILSKRRELIL